MNKIAIISTNPALKETLKEYLSPENFLISFRTLDDLDEALENIIIVDFISVEEARNTNLKREYHFKMVPILGILNQSILPSLNLPGMIDDFILDNFTSEELNLRIKLLLWRAYGIDTENIIQIQDLIIDLAKHKVLIDYEPVDLTYMEFKLLLFLVSNKNRVFSREYILERVWGYNYYGGDRTVDVHVRRLRSKLAPKYGQFIETVRNVGYKFNI